LVEPSETSYVNNIGTMALSLLTNFSIYSHQPMVSSFSPFMFSKPREVDSDKEEDNYPWVSEVGAIVNLLRRSSVKDTDAMNFIDKIRSWAILKVDGRVMSA